MDTIRGIANALLTGRMRLVSREEKQPGNAGSVLGFATARVPLTRRELLVLAATEGGVANKLIAIEQSLACSTVSESLRTAVTKLGFAGRTEFLKVMACLRSHEDGSDRGVRLVGSSDRCWLYLSLEALGSHARLTDAERQVVMGVLHGRTNAAIALGRRTSRRTVANQLAAIYRKLGVSSRWELAAHVGAAATTTGARDAVEVA